MVGKKTRLTLFLVITGLLLVFPNTSNFGMPISTAGDVTYEKPGSTDVLTPEFTINTLSNNNTFDFTGPWGIVEVKNHIYVVNEGRHTVGMYDLDGTFIKRINPDPSVDNFYAPSDITHNGTHLFVLDKGRGRVVVFTLDGEYVDHFAQLGTGYGEIDYAYTLASNDSHIFILDDDQTEIEIFTETGQFVTNESLFPNFDFVYGMDYEEKTENFYLVSNTQDSIWITDTTGTRVDTFLTGLVTPWEVEVYNDLIYVGNSSILQIYDKQGRLRNSIHQFQGMEFSEIVGIHVTEERVYISDRTLEKVFVFKRNVDGLRAQVRDHQIRLSWNGPTTITDSSIQYYKIYRGINDSKLTYYDTVYVPELDYIDNFVQPGEIYKYAVSVVTDLGETEISNQVSVTLSTASSSVSNSTQSEQTVTVTEGNHTSSVTVTTTNSKTGNSSNATDQSSNIQDSLPIPIWIAPLSLLVILIIKKQNHSH